MENTEKPDSEPLNESEKEALEVIAEVIEEAVYKNDSKIASYLRNQLIDAANIGIVPKETAITGSLPTPKMEVKKGR